jgi:hypothetical protein
MVAVSSDSFCGVNANPAEKSTSIFRPGTVRKFFARLRTASSMLRAPKSAAALPSDDKPVDAIVTGTFGAGAFGSTDEVFTPDTAARSTSALAVKFCTMRSEPPKSTTAIKRSGPAFAAMNLVAALRAWIWSGAAIVELSKNKIRYRRCPFDWVAASAPAEKEETCFSLLSSKTLKSFCVRSRM